MRSERQRAGVFRSIFSLVTHNWALKILSLVLAVIIYHLLKPGNGFTQEPNDRYIFQKQ